MKILVCLPTDEERAADVLSAGARLAAGMRGRLCAAHVYPAGRGEALRDCGHESLAGRFQASSWLLETDSPPSALLGLARRQGVNHMILGPVARRRWGKALWDVGEARGELALCWMLPDAGFDCAGLSLTSGSAHYRI